MESTRVEYGKALAELGGENPDIVVLDADLSGSTQTSRFAQLYPERFFNVGIAEQDLMGTAAGLAVGARSPLPAPSPSSPPAGPGSRSARPSPTAT